jgi:UDPglucose--hexose-1-phosphate uridylyltransferase
MRPHDILTHQDVPVAAKECPFCKERLSSKPALDGIGTPKKWQIRVIKNEFPYVTRDNPKAYGAQEVVIETSEHNKELANFTLDHIVRLLKVYARRTVAISKDKKIRYILTFKNNGGVAGASLVHAHSQIFATDLLPPHVVDKLKRSAAYEAEHKSCYYCDLVKAEMKSPRKIYSDDYVAALTPYASLYNYEAWILPKRHVDNITLLTAKELNSFAKALKGVLMGINELQLPYNYYMHQVVANDHEHLYLRIAPRRDVWAGVELGSRLVINSVPPEEAAEFYRKHIIR